MLRILSLAFVGIFTVSLVGCRAGAEVDATDDRRTDRDMRYERTTTVDPDSGDRTVREERRIER